jgi:hypothetical protein
MASSDNITKRVTDGEQFKGQTSTQEYDASTTRKVSSPTLVSEETTNLLDPVTTTEAKVGDVTETRTNTGVGTVTTTNEDKGVVLRFTIPIQQRNPIVRSP